MQNSACQHIPQYSLNPVQLKRYCGQTYLLVTVPTLQANFSQSKNANFQNLCLMHFRKFKVSTVWQRKTLDNITRIRNFYIDLFMYIGIRNFECQSQSQSQIINSRFHKFDLLRNNLF